MNSRFKQWAATVGVPSEDISEFFDASVNLASEMIDRVSQKVTMRFARLGLEEHQDAGYHLVCQMMASWAAEDMADGWGWDEREFFAVAPDAMMDCLELHLDHLQSSRKQYKENQSGKAEDA